MGSLVVDDGDGFLGFSSSRVNASAPEPAGGADWWRARLPELAGLSIAGLARSGQAGVLLAQNRAPKTPKTRKTPFFVMSLSPLPLSGPSKRAIVPCKTTGNSKPTIHSSSPHCTLTSDDSSSAHSQGTPWVGSPPSPLTMPHRPARP